MSLGLEDRSAERGGSNNELELGLAETDGATLGTEVGDKDRDSYPVRVTLDFAETDRTRVGRSLRLPDMLGDMLRTWVGLFDSKGLLLSLNDGSAEKDGSYDGQKLEFAETDGAALGTEVGDTYKDSCPMGMTLGLAEAERTKVGRFLGHTTHLVICWELQLVSSTAKGCFWFNETAAHGRYAPTLHEARGLRKRTAQR